MPALLLYAHRRADQLTLSVVGPVDRDTASSLRERLRTELGRHPGAHVELDMRCCTGVDVEGLRALDDARRAACADGGDLRLVRVPPLIEDQVHRHALDHLTAAHT